MSSSRNNRIDTTLQIPVSSLARAENRGQRFSFLRSPVWKTSCSFMASIARALANLGLDLVDLPGHGVARGRGRDRSLLNERDPGELASVEGLDGEADDTVEGSLHVLLVLSERASNRGERLRDVNDLVGGMGHVEIIRPARRRGYGYGWQRLQAPTVPVPRRPRGATETYPGGVSTSPEPVRLTADEAAAVLRRAVALDAGLVAPAGADMIEVGVLEQAATEAGVSPDAVRQAVAELRAGALVPVTGASAPGTSRRLMGPRVAADQRVLGLVPEQALDRAGHALQRQLFELRRADTTRALWRRRTDIAASIQRVVDLTGRIKFSSVDAIMVTAVPVGSGGPGASLVRVEADLANLRSVVAASAAVPAGIAWAGGTVVTLATGEPMVLAAASAGGMAAGGVGLSVGRAWYRRQHRQVGELLGWLLDQIGRSPPRA